MFREPHPQDRGLHKAIVTKSLEMVLSTTTSWMHFTADGVAHRDVNYVHHYHSYSSLAPSSCQYQSPGVQARIPHTHVPVRIRTSAVPENSHQRKAAMAAEHATARQLSNRRYATISPIRTTSCSRQAATSPYVLNGYPARPPPTAPLTLAVHYGGPGCERERRSMDEHQQHSNRRYRSHPAACCMPP
jgi:hypothetical protein